MEDDMDSLLRRAKELVNDEFRIKSSRKNQENNSPNSSQATTIRNEPTVQSKYESVKEARKRLRQEWEALKNRSLTPNTSIEEAVKETRKKESDNEVLYGIVVYVEIGGNERHVTGLKHILKSLGATVKDTFTKEVTHIVYKNGTIDTYKRAKLLNTHLVSVLWVEACRNSKSKVCERLFPVYDTNDYSNSPRVFRRFMEYQSKHFEYDASIGEIIRKPLKQKHQSLIQNLQRLNIARSDKTDETTSKHLDTSSDGGKSKSDSSNNVSVQLHISTDESDNNDIQKDNVSTDASDNSNPMIDENDDLENPKQIDEGITLELRSSNTPSKISRNAAADNGEEENQDVSPSKRRLFAKRPLQESFVNFSQEEHAMSRLVVPNPYSVSNAQISKNLTTTTVDKSLKNKKKSPVKKLSLNKQTDKPVISMYNGIKMFNNVFKKTHNPFRPPSKYVYSEHRKCPSLVSTSLHSQENRSLKQLVTRLGGFHLKARVDGTTTHLICGENRRTVNLLKAVARGCWVLSPRWLQDSASAGRWLAENHYEMIDFSKVVQRSRLQKQSFGKEHTLNIFDDCGPIYIGLNASPPCSDLKELISLCGGKVTLSPSTARVIVGEKIDSCQRCVTEKWILDSITFGRCKTLSKYAIEK